MIQLCNQTGSYNLLLWLHLLKGMGLSFEGVPQQGTVLLPSTDCFFLHLCMVQVCHVSVCHTHCTCISGTWQQGSQPLCQMQHLTYCHQCANRNSCSIAVSTPTSPGELVTILPFCSSDYCPGLAQSCRILSELQSCISVGLSCHLPPDSVLFFIFVIALAFSLLFFHLNFLPEFEISCREEKENLLLQATLYSQ